MEAEYETERAKKEKYEEVIRDSQLQKQLMNEKIEEVEMQLQYEKEFNRKFEGTIAEVNDVKEQLHKELNVQMDINK